LPLVIDAAQLPNDSMKTKIAKRLFRELEQLSESAPELLARLSVDLPSMAPQLYPFDSLIGVVRDVIGDFRPPAVDGREEKSSDFAKDLGQSLSGLLYTAGASALSSDEVIASAIATIESNFPEHAEGLSSFVRNVLGCRNLLLSFKSTALREDNENIVVDSKIIIDIRPIFDFDPSEAIRAHTLLYRLKITHRTTSNVETKIYTLSQVALDELSEAVDRSKRKIGQLKSTPMEQTLGLLLEEEQ
jgi:hypothetical protein